MLKPRLQAVAIATAAVLALAACNSTTPTDPVTPIVDPSATAGPVLTPEEDLAALSAVQWTDGADGVPALTFDLPLSVSGPVAVVHADGDGDELQAGDVVSLHYVVYSGATGVADYSTYEFDAPEPLPLNENEVDPTLWDALVGNKVGAKVLFATLDYGSADADGNVPTIVLAVVASAVTTVPDRAEGEPLKPEEGLPVVTLDDTGAPSIDFTGITMPEGLVVQPLIKGDGVPVAEGQSLTVHYTGWLWDGDVFDSSWDRGGPSSFALSRGQLIDGWVEGLVGQPVGSQVLLIIPPELAYGDAGNSSIPGGATLAFVIDILAAN